MKKISKLLEEFSNPEIRGIEKLEFSGVGEKNVYNISKRFIINKEEFLFGRVEPKDNSELSKVFLFRKSCGIWIPDSNFIPLENSEDPFILKIDNEFILGCVEVIPIKERSEFDFENKLNYRTILYRGENPWKLKRIFEGPWKMKDIRFVQLPNKEIAVFSRPQGGKAGRGKIGFFIVNSLEKLNEKNLYESPLLDNFHESEWGGVNEAFVLDDERIGILGHIAKRNEDNSLSYYPMIFTINFRNMEHSEIKIILRGENLPGGESKNERLTDVIFPGGFEINDDGTIDLYAGARDAEAYKINIKNPFQ